MKDESHTEDVTMPTEYSQPAPLVDRIHTALIDLGIPEHKVRSEITRVTGVSKQNLTHWFNGTTEKPDSDHVIAISNEYNIDLVWLFTGKSQQQYKENRLTIEKETGGSCVNIAKAENVYFQKKALGE